MRQVKLCRDASRHSPFSFMLLFIIWALSHDAFCFASSHMGISTQVWLEDLTRVPTARLRMYLRPRRDAEQLRRSAAFAWINFRGNLRSMVNTTVLPF